MEIEQTLYWLFSTIAQSYGAIVGIIGLLVVYRLDNQSRLKDSTKDRLLNNENFHYVFGDMAYGWSPEDISYNYHNLDIDIDSDQKRRYDGKIIQNTNRHYFEGEISGIDRSIVLGTAIRKGFRSFVKFHLGLIIGPIFLIHLVPIPFSYCQTFIRPAIFITVLVILIVVLSISCKMIWTMAMTLLDEEKKGG